MRQLDRAGKKRRSRAPAYRRCPGAIISDFILLSLSLYCKAAGEAWSNPNSLVFTNELGAHLTHLTVYKDFKAIVRAMGYETTRFHDLRHSYAVAAIESGDDIKTVQSNLGHATASFTLDVYGHASQKMMQRSAERMERYIQDVFSN